ncbi:quorum sensing histidine kinase QseC [Leminorella grimontii]|uniref:quorum sensing histidine kinase QseC n=1 Tax=Leminorella grimontii TaxID=82981 RepID=UPI0020854830|nr:quorum sensing histidine kinase QseC [Leminorella grimontii]GKX58034.1 two-component sensor histidine kinase [Leminorella grimontii]
MKNLSLRTRLIAIFTLLIVLSWTVSAAIGYVKVRHRVRLMFDAEQILFAQRLERSGLDDLLKLDPNDKKTAFSPHFSHQAREAISYAIFTREGKRLIGDKTDEAEITYSPNKMLLGDKPQFIEGKKWRVLWLVSQDKRFVIAIAQETAYRERLAKNILWDHQVTPWGIMLPIMLIAIFFLISHELAPLKRVSRALKKRAPDDESPIEEEHMPKEVQPFVNALNALFRKTGDLLRRERRFVSDAAHELRSPLTALKVQTEVAQMTANKPEVQKRALGNLTLGIDRASRLVDQLLTLSRLDAQSEIPDREAVNWRALLEEMRPTFEDTAQAKGTELKIDYRGDAPVTQGNVVLLSLLIRNLVDNALHYTPEGGTVHVTLSHETFIVEDSGPGVTKEHLARMGERFYRPPGQKKIGSGLGISIVKQIAELHRLKVAFRNGEQRGFIAEVSFK